MLLHICRATDTDQRMDFSQRLLGLIFENTIRNCDIVRYFWFEEKQPNLIHIAGRWNELPFLVIDPPSRPIVKNRLDVCRERVFDVDDS